MSVTQDLAERLMTLLILMKLPKEKVIEIALALGTVEEMHSFLNKLSAKNYEMTPEEVYQAAGA